MLIIYRLLAAQQCSVLADGTLMPMKALMDMRWRRLNGATIDGHLLDAIEAAIKREHGLGNKLKVCIAPTRRSAGRSSSSRP